MPNRRAFRLRLHPALCLALLALGGLAALAGCGKSNELTVDVRDEENHPVAGVEIRQVGSEQPLGVTGQDGRAAIGPKVEGESVQVRLSGGETGGAALLFDNPYTVDADALKRGYRLFRVGRGRAGPADSTAVLQVVSVPAGAEVLLDGTPRGTTPATIDSLAPGPVTLELRLDGWHAHRVDLYLTAGGNNYSHELTRAEVTTASLQVLSDPGGARVTLNGKSTGKKTPADFSGLPAGTYSVEVAKSGYKSWSTRLRLEPGRNGVADAGLLAAAGGGGTTPTSGGGASADHGDRTRTDTESSGGGGTATTPPPNPDFEKNYSVSTAPGFTEVYVDGESINRNQTGNFRITLKAGTHRFRLKNETAGVDMVLRYTVKSGDPNDVLILNYESRKVAARDDPRAGR